MSLAGAALLVFAHPTPVPLPPAPPLVDGPYQPTRQDVEDDEIVWLASAETHYWQLVLGRAAASREVLNALQTRGLGKTCRWFSDLREGTIARYFRPYREAVVAEFRRTVPALTFVNAAEYGPMLAPGHIGYAPFQRAIRRADELGRPSIEAGARGVEAHLRVWTAGTSTQLSDRLRPETLALLQRQPDALPYWCANPADQRERLVGGYWKGTN